MKSNIFTVALSLLSVAAVAQKSEIKDAGDAIDDGKYAEAKTQLKTAESLLSEANEKWTERFYLYKGQAYLGSGENASLEDLEIAAEAFKQAQDLGNSDEAVQGFDQVRNALVQSAINDQNTENYKNAADKLHYSYQLNKQDTLYLYYAAANSLNAQDYTTALEYYETLKELGFDGSGVEYLATNVETGEEEVMNKEQRELMLKTGEYKDPRDQKIPSKKGEIAKNIALIYIQEGEDEKAIAAIKDAKEENPDNVALLQAEADVYYRMGDKEKYNELMQEMVKKNPNDPNIYYNLGVTAAELGDNEKAIEYYKKALEIDPDMTNARMNIVVAILAKERSIIDEMNGLGMSKEDNKRYEELEEERNKIYKQAVPYLEKVIEADPENTNVIRTAINIYNQLGEDEKAKALKARLQ
ncbi:tetratricopeptide repeat protein [Salegentibacter sp. BLCTC]|uniref:Tetratricopeptide repeat protein n=1 Tax=Salegentibacter maritimus TaxID=2794347 RepID=A0ABS0TFM5_9FLAO|nr:MULTISPECIES: tetratricopeptide repeat protein [Salegentibacter]MBE7639128.1 tetratricopeptide repeat protein [Salegentibacter sp. BLCTC]MBI6119857.1 tetratricopeptide repeat protein [Salegentibacter maritimus]